MKVKNLLIIFIFCLIVAIPLVTKGHEDESPGSVRIIKDLEYAGTSNPAQTLDLYLPTPREQKKPLPLIVFIHGGAWIEGSKENGPCLYLTQQGFAAASINYRLSTEAIYPAQIDDVKKAILFLRKHAAEHGINPDRIGVWGISAGGHLAALIGTIGSTNGAAGNDSVQAVLDWCGVSDLASVSAQAGSKTKLDFDDPQGPVAKFLGGLPADKPALAAQASPVNHISKDDPPFLLVHGDIDDVVPFAQSQELYDRLKQAGVPVELKVVKGGGHMFGDENQMKRAVDFFKATLVDGQRNFSLPD